MGDNSSHLPGDKIVIEEKLTLAEIAFEKWPRTLGLFIVLFPLIKIIHPPEKKRLSGIKGYIKERRSELGRWKRGKRSCTLCFFVEFVLLKTPLSCFSNLCL